MPLVLNRGESTSGCLGSATRPSISRSTTTPEPSLTRPAGRASCHARREGPDPAGGAPHAHAGGAPARGGADVPRIIQRGIPCCIQRDTAGGEVGRGSANRGTLCQPRRPAAGTRSRFNGPGAGRGARRILEMRRIPAFIGGPEATRENRPR